MESVLKYFPDLTSDQKDRFIRLESLYNYWNQHINVISRKDIGGLYERHVLHSLSIAKIIRFTPETSILDAGTGGGFPGIPLAILFPSCNFHLVDSTGKKIKVVNDIAGKLNLTNVRAEQKRAEQLKEKYDFIVSRSVTSLQEFFKWVEGKVSGRQQNPLPNGILYLKGGDFENELSFCKNRVLIYPLKELFNEPYFETKKLVYIPV